MVEGEGGGGSTDGAEDAVREGWSRAVDGVQEGWSRAMGEGSGVGRREEVSYCSELKPDIPPTHLVVGCVG